MVPPMAPRPYDHRTTRNPQATTLLEFVIERRVILSGHDCRYISNERASK